MNTVLIVEDDLRLATHWQSLLEADDIRVIHEVTAEAAIDCLKSDPSVDVVVTDMMLAGGASAYVEQGGLLVLAFVSLNLNPAPRVLAITGVSSSPEFMSSFNLLSPQNVLLKPISDDTFRAKVKEMLSERVRETARLKQAVLTEVELRKFKYAVENSADLKFHVRPDSMIAYANEQATQRLGYSRQELCTKSITQIDQSWVVPEWEEFCRTSVVSEQAGLVESELTCSDGSKFFGYVSRKLLDFEGDEFVYVTIRDITKQKQAERALRRLNKKMQQAVRKSEESERRFRSLADSASPLSWTTELDSSCSWLNKRWVDYSGRPLEQQLGFGWMETVHSDDRDRTKAAYLEAFENKEAFILTYRLRRYDGVYRWHTVNATPRLDEDDQFIGYVGMSFDDHEAYESRVALEQSESSLRLAVTRLEETKQQLMSVESSQRAMLNLLGATDGVWDWRVGTDEAEFAPGFRRLLGFGGEDVETFPDSLKSLQDRVHRDDSEGLWDCINDRLGQRLPFEYEFRLRQKNDGYIWVRSRGTASYDSHGQPERLIGSTQSIEAQKLAEQSMRQANEELRRANFDLEQFAYVASHDLKEPLRAISGFAQLLQQKYDHNLDQRGRGYIRHVVTGVSRMQQLMDDLLHFSQISNEDIKFSTIDLAECIDEAKERVRASIQESGAVITVGEMPQILGLQTQIIQLFQNLIGNAIKYRPKGTPTIKISSNRDEEYWEINVQDNGIGIADEHRARIFALFKRLHRREEYPGTGIGLAICQRVVDGHNGTISVSSTIGVGSCFTVRLPVFQPSKFGQ